MAEKDGTIEIPSVSEETDPEQMGALARDARKIFKTIKGSRPWNLMRLYGKRG